MRGRILIIAGSDSGGGAGIQGDIKTVSALGGYAMTAVTALTAQNTQGVFGIHEVPPEFIARQIRLVLEDIGADAIKTGMLHSAAVIEAVAVAVAPYLREHAIPLVVDPVMAAKGGAPLLQAEAVDALKRHLFPIARLITPNIPEAALLCAHSLTRREEMEDAARQMCAQGAQAVLLKGGHLEGETLYDLLLGPDGAAHWFESPRLATQHTHGTGCALASAIATFLAQGAPLPDATARARAYVQGAIRAAPGFGGGHGPLNHSFATK